ncbi:MAG TPA: AI-2E family transporter [Candidatus Limnocylindrales bacterium]
MEPAARTAPPPADAPFAGRSSGAAGPPGLPPDPAVRGPDRRLRPPTPRVALLLVAAAALAFVLYLGRDVLAPFVIGLLLVYLLDPPVERLCRIYVPRWLAVLLVYGVALAVLVGGLDLLLAPVVQQLSAFVTGLPQYVADVDRQLQHLTAAYRGLDLPPEIRRALDQLGASITQRAGTFDPTVLLPVFSSIAGLVASFFGYLIVPVWTFYLLKDRPALTASFDQAVPEAWRADAWAVARIVDRVFRQWLVGQLFLGLTVGVATYVGLVILGNAVDPLFGRYALLLATVAGLFELLPIVGPILAAIPAVLLALTISLQAVVPVIVLYFAIQQLENNLLVPKIQGDAVRLHPSAVMFALVVGGAIAGLIGAILALPIAAAARDIYRYLFRRLSESPAVPTPATAEALATSAPLAEDAAPRHGRGDVREPPVAPDARPGPGDRQLRPPERPLPSSDA